MAEYELRKKEEEEEMKFIERAGLLTVCAFYSSTNE